MNDAVILDVIAKQEETIEKQTRLIRKLIEIILLLRADRKEQDHDL